MKSVQDEEDTLLYQLDEEAAKRDRKIIALRACQIIDFSTHYGSDDSVSYTAENMIGPPTIFPRSGDHAYSFQLRTYGRWWYCLPSSRKITINLPYECPVESQDFIEFRVDKRVVPVLIRIYEVYNPGSIVKVLCYCYDAERWVILYQGGPKVLPPNEAHCFSVDIKGINFLSDLFRIEFYHKHLNYYCELDSLIIYGELKFPLSFPSYNLPRSKYPKLCLKGINYPCDLNQSDETCESTEHFALYFDMLPREVMHIIISYLDLSSLCTSARVSKLFRELCYDPVLYKDLNLQLYWHLVNITTLKGLQSRLTSLKRLNLAWCGGQGRITPPYFIEFLELRCQFLTSLNISCCPFVNSNCLKAIANYCPCLQDLEMRCCRAKDLTQSGFKYISQMANLNYLDLYRTLIHDSSILAIIKSCTKLEHLFLGSCTNIDSFNEVAQAIGRHLKYVKTLDLWRACSLTCIGIYEFAENCHDLVELDLGWCYQVDAGCGCLRQLISRCQKLKKLTLSAIRTVSDNDINAISNNCKHIEQLDILGTSEVGLLSVQSLLLSCKNLKLLDVSYCDNTVKSGIPYLQHTFPSVEIKCGIPPNMLAY